jgi:predicted dehydrogenase
LIKTGSGQTTEGRAITKTLNVGMIGYGLMAKAHSNAWRRVADFFPALEHRPVLKAVAARTADKVSAFADVWATKASRPTGSA